MTTQPTDQVQRVLASWHSTHPRATLAEIEAAVEDELDHLRARLVKERTDSAFVDEHPLCQHCGSGMVLRAITTRTVFLRGDEPLELEAEVCGLSNLRGGFFPPWMSSSRCCRPPTHPSWSRRSCAWEHAFPSPKSPRRWPASSASSSPLIRSVA